MAKPKGQMGQGNPVRNKVGFKIEHLKQTRAMRSQLAFLECVRNSRSEDADRGVLGRIGVPSKRVEGGLDEVASCTHHGY